MTAMLATPEVVSDLGWFPGSRAINHCTPTVGNPTNKSTYDGPDQVYMGNGEAESISHIGEGLKPKSKYMIHANGN